jgi:hypothetical protein
LLLFLILYSCKAIPRRFTTSDNSFGEALLRKLENKKYEYISCEQIDVIVTSGDKKSFKSKIFIRKEHFIFISISLLGFEIGRAELSPDSIKIINRIERTYYFSKLENFTEKFKIDFSYSEIESLILNGMSWDPIYNRKDFLNRLSVKDNEYIFTDRNSSGFLMKTFYDRSTYRISKLEIENVDKNMFYLLALIPSFNTEGNYPEIINVYLKKRDYIANVDLKIGSILFNEFDRKPFLINSKYREIEFK